MQYLEVLTWKLAKLRSFWVFIIIILYVSFRSITMQNLEAVALKLAELWPFYDFSKIISDSEILDIHTYGQSDLYYPLAADKKGVNVLQHFSFFKNIATKL